MEADLSRQRLVVVLGWGGENGETDGIMAKQYSRWNLPCGPRVKTLHTQCRQPGFDPWSWKEIPHATIKSVGATKGPHAVTKIEDPASHTKARHSQIYM